MGLSSTTNRVSYTGDGSSTVFSFPYYFFSPSDLQVYLFDTGSSVVTAQALNTNFTVSGSVSAQGVYPSGGNVVMNSAFPSNLQIIIARSPSQVQNFALQQNSPINSLALVQQFDYLTTLVQRLQEEVSRCIQLPDGVGTIGGNSFSQTLPATVLLNSTANAPLVLNSGATGWTFGLVATGASGAVAYYGTLPVTNGGTGQSGSLSTFGVLYAASSSAVAVLPNAPANLFLTTNASSAPSWSTISVNSGSVSGTLPIANGGTGFVGPYPQYGLVYASSSTQFATVPSAASNQLLQANGSAAPSWLGFSSTLASSNIVSRDANGNSQFGAVNMYGSSGVGGFNNVGLGGPASLSNLYPLFVQRTTVGGTTNTQFSNPDTTAGAAFVCQFTVNGANQEGDLMIFSQPTVSTDAYTGGAFVLRATQTTPHMSFVSDNAGGDIKFYTDGYAINNKRLLVNSGGIEVLNGGALYIDAGSGRVAVMAGSTGSWNFNLPTGPGTSGQLLTSQGGGSSQMTWTNISSLSIGVASKTASYQMTSSDDVIFVNSSSLTITLPDATTAIKKTYRVVNISSGAVVTGGPIVLQGSGSQTIGSFGNQVHLWTPNESWEIVPDGANFQVVNHKTDAGVFPWTPAFQGLGTPTQVSLFWTREGSKLRGYGNFTPSATSNSSGFIGLPINVSLNSSVLTASSCQMVGRIVSTGGASANGNLLTQPSSCNSSVFIGLVSSNGGTIFNPPSTNNAGFTAPAAGLAQVEFSVPVYAWES